MCVYPNLDFHDIFIIKEIEYEQKFILPFKYFIHVSLPIKRNLYISELIFYYISDLYNKV